ncbi:hypothetical protein AGR56_10240 [Clostridium sp. DMHC 10]|uniref:DUF624 domain-containing protein n=1 Tax=Clostridium sp. DMHC 10 TaxID=747377 RepID=UPI00069E65F3|nr:DUF624 domain-containing protein [Clostridium sp. DMHC 10]KOF56966.1 hypothetical protein AGR56_10240 [Clostridium sp. DMHC 10]
MKNDDLQDSKFYILGTYLWLFIVASLWFVIFNIPFLIAVVFYASIKSSLTWIIMLIASAFIGPTVIAMFYTMNKAYKNKEMDNTTKNFLKGYKANFFEGIFYWCIFLAMYIGLYFYRIYFMAALGPQTGFAYLIILLQMILLAIAIMNFVIVSRFYLSIKNALKISIYESVKNIKLFIQILGVIVIYMIALKYLGNCVFLLISAVSYFIIVILSPVLKNVENEFSNKNVN